MKTSAKCFSQGFGP